MTVLKQFYFIITSCLSRPGRAPMFLDVVFGQLLFGWKLSSAMGAREHLVGVVRITVLFQV